MFKSIKERDPAARSSLQILLLYPGVQAVLWFRVAHFLYAKGFIFLGEAIMYGVRCCLGIEIHPAATIGKGLFIDHGTGVVIGATAIVGKDVTIFHGVTLGGLGVCETSGRRHPIIEDGVMIGSGAKVLGPITVGANSRIGANAVVLADVPANSTAVGIPATCTRKSLV